MLHCQQTMRALRLHDSLTLTADQDCLIDAHAM